MRRTQPPRDVIWRQLLLEHHGSPELRLRNLEEASWRDSSPDASWRDSSLDVVASHGCDLKDNAQGAVRGDAAVDEALSDSEDETLVAVQDRVCSLRSSRSRRRATCQSSDGHRR